MNWTSSRTAVAWIHSFPKLCLHLLKKKEKEKEKTPCSALTPTNIISVTKYIYIERA